MKPKRSFSPAIYSSLLALALTCLGCCWAEEPQQQEIPEPYRTFMPEAQKHVAEFPEIPVGISSAEHKFVTVRLDEKPIVVGEHRFGCVRFVAPKDAGRDMVWAFSMPPEWQHWYIIPASGTMAGFRNWLDADCLYEGLPSTLANVAHFQILEAKNFKSGETYILWFKQEKKADGPAMLTAAINFLPPPGEKKKWDIEQIVKGLHLKPAPMADEAAYFNSRGGKALLDKRFFEPSYGEDRIGDLLYALRHDVMNNGWFVKMNVIIPVCKTEPLLSDVQAAYGDADLVLPPKDRQLFYGKDAPEGEAAYYYDHFAFLVKDVRGKPRIVRVTSDSEDVSPVRPQHEGLTWNDVPLANLKLRIFYRDRKEIARIAFWGEEGAKLLSGDLPEDTYTRAGDDVITEQKLKYLGKGAWEYKSVYVNGQTQQTYALKDHALQGPLHAYYPDGKPQAEANYDKGRLDGALKQWSEDGQSSERHFKAGELQQETGTIPR